MRNSSYVRFRIGRSIISTVKPIFIRIRIVALVIILSAVFITLAVGEASSAAPSVGDNNGIESIQYYVTNNTYHILDIYFNQYGEPMNGAVVSNSLTSLSGYSAEKTATINSHGYAVVNFTVNDNNINYCASYHVQVLPPLNASEVTSVNESLMAPSMTASTNQDSNFTFNAIYAVQGRYSYETAFLFFHYNSKGYRAPDNEFKLYYTNIPYCPFFASCNNRVKQNVSGYINMGIMGGYTSSLVDPNYQLIPKANLSSSKTNLFYGSLQEYENGKWVTLTVDKFIDIYPSGIGEFGYNAPNLKVYLQPTSTLLTAPTYSIFFGFPAIIPVLLGILSEVVIFGLPRSSGTTDLYLSRSGSRSGLMLKRMVGSFILLIMGIVLGFLGFLVTIFYYTGVLPTIETDLFVVISLFLVGVAFISLSFLISSRAKSTTLNVLAPFAIFFGLYYLLDKLIVGIYSILITKGIVMSPLALYFIEVLDPFNILSIMQVDLVPNTKVSIPVPFGFGLTDYFTILLMWSVIPAILAFLLWKNAE